MDTIAKFKLHFEKKLDQNFTFWDISFLKLYGLLFGLILGANFPAIIFKSMYGLITIFLILMVRYLYLLFIK